MSKVGKRTAGEGLTYKASGVDIDKGADFVRAIAPMAGSTDRPGVVSGIGGFGGFFDPAAAGYTDPLLVAATDGVGTKLKIAIETGRHDTVGIDLVAMCVNDLVVQGAEPLFFLDYFATGALNNAAAEQVLSGIAAGCREAGCALIGGETAEMPGMYGGGDYDLAGFAVGAVERDGVLPRTDIAAGDTILGLASSGLHSNGFSLVRKVVEAAGLRFTDAAPFGDSDLGEVLLTPTRIYVKSCLAAVRTGKVKALAHITGGGLVDNIPRVLPEGLGADLDAAAWSAPAVFDWLAEAGGIAGPEMAHAFNCGIGMAVVTAPGDAGEITALLSGQGEVVSTIGSVAARQAGEPEVHVAGIEEKWRR